MSVKSEILVLLKQNALIVCMFLYFMLLIALPHSRELVLQSLYGIIVLSVISLGVISLLFDIYKIIHRSKELE